MVCLNGFGENQSFELREKRCLFVELSRKRFSLFQIFNSLLIGSFTFICLYPFYYMLINTISNNNLSSNGDVIFFPQGIHFSNYIQVFQIPGIAHAAFISFARTSIGTGAIVISAAFLGYLFTRQEMWGRKFWYRFIVASMYFNAGLIPWYLTMRNLHMTNNFLAYILPLMINPFYLILVKTFVESIPNELHESAEIDGAGYFTIFFRVIWPLCTPILATVAIFAAVEEWNQFKDTLFLMTNNNLYTLQFILYRYMNEATSLAAMIKNTQGAGTIDIANMQTPDSVRATVAMIVTFPILFVYPFFQRYLISGIMLGAVKG